jgi:hypothetical protein
MAGESRALLEEFLARGPREEQAKYVRQLLREEASTRP